MPTFRKVELDEARGWQRRGSPRPTDDRYAWVEREAVLFVGRRGRPLSLTPRIGDVLRLRAAEGTAAERITGIVLGVRVRRDGIWTHAQLAVNGQISWVTKSTVATHLGRMKGITRVDQPTKHVNGRVHGGTHGWFVRIYEGTLPRIARTFSDRLAGGQLASLKAALAFHAAHVGIDAAEGILFP
jgi:hypothetical protein